MVDYISPGSFSAKELGNLLIDLQKSVIAIAGISEDVDIADDFSLKEIKDKSAGFHLYSNQPSVNDACIRLIKAIDQKDFTGLPRDSFEGVKQISEFTSSAAFSYVGLQDGTIMVDLSKTFCAYMIYLK